MQLQFESDLVEQAVFLEMRRREQLGAGKLVSRFRKQLDHLYELPSSAAREKIFFDLHLRYFKELGFEKFLLSLLNERPLIPQLISTAIFRKVRGKNEEGAELFVKDADKIKNLSVALRSERFEDIPCLKAFLRHELYHISDMLDPQFGYVPDIRLPDRPAAEENLLRDRYRVLWDVTIDGRLERARLELDTPKEKRANEFHRAFVFLPESERQARFNQLWNGERPTHAQLVEFAQHAREYMPHESQLGTPSPGAHCPLCGFTAFDWAQPAALTDELRAVIQEKFPRWTPQQGACARCVEIYGTPKHEMPATLYL